MGVSSSGSVLLIEVDVIGAKTAQLSSTARAIQRADAPPVSSPFIFQANLVAMITSRDVRRVHDQILLRQPITIGVCSLEEVNARIERSTND